MGDLIDGITRPIPNEPLSTEGHSRDRKTPHRARCHSLNRYGSSEQRGKTANWPRLEGLG
jgi:hypothetical protein